MKSSINPASKHKCGKYGPGHEVFYMHQLRVLNSRDLTECELLEVDGLSLTVCIDGQWVQTFWTHDADLLKQCLERAASPDFKLGYGRGILVFEGTAPGDWYATRKCLYPLETAVDCDIEVSAV